MKDTRHTEELLRHIEERMARAVCNGYIVSREDANQVHYLRQRVGKKWNAIDRRWEPLDSDRSARLRPVCEQ